MDRAAAVKRSVDVVELVGQTQAARELGLSVWQVERLVRTGKLEHVRLPNDFGVVVRESLEAYKTRVSLPH